jgi:hypothetical protein
MAQCKYPIYDSLAGPEQRCQFESKPSISKWDSPFKLNLGKILNELELS